MTRKELAVKACLFAVVSLMNKGSSMFLTLEAGEAEAIEWLDVIKWLEEVNK